MNSLDATALSGMAPRARALHQLRQWIAEGALAAGQPLPAERALAQTLGVNRGTLRSALQMLSEEGLLRSNGGRMRLVAPHAGQDESKEAQSGVMSETIAVITLDTEQLPSGHRQQGWREFITRGALRAIRNRGYHAMLVDPERLSPERLDRLIAGKPRGVLLTDIDTEAPAVPRILEAFRKGGVPVVAYSGAPELAAYDRVVSDHAAGAYQLARWLIDKGRRRILNLWPETATGYWFAGRREGYERAMREAGLQPLPPLLVPQQSFVPEEPAQEVFEHQARLTAGYLAEHLTGRKAVDAIMLSSDSNISVVAAACRLFGKQIHRDVTLVGYDNYWDDWAKTQHAFEPATPLATIDKRNSQLGKELVQLLLERLAGHLPAGPQCRVVSPQLVVLDSSQAPSLNGAARSVSGSGDITSNINAGAAASA